MSAGDSGPMSGQGSPAFRLCARCGGEFSCGASFGSCWCEAVEVGPTALTRLRERFTDCLCERCLKEEAAG